MNSEKVKIRELFSVLYRYKISIFLIFVITLGFSIQITTFLKKKYKSEFEINVYSKYFKNALISDIIPGVYQIPEMRFTIDSMVKEAISDDFIDQIATDFKIYSLDTDELTLAKNRQFLRNRFSAFSTGGQSYQVTFTDSDPYVAKLVAERTLDRVKAQFVNSRIETIEMVKQMMFNRLKALNASQKFSEKGSEKALASKSPDVLQAELDKINANYSALSKQYNTSHPKIQELLARKRTIEIWLEEFEQSSFSNSDVATSFSMPTDKLVNEQITSKFYTKYHDFNMALDIEKKSLESYIGVIKKPQLPTAAIWPKKRLFAAVGFILAMIFSFCYVFIKEVMVPGQSELLQIEAEKLGAVYLGKIDINAIKKSANSEIKKVEHIEPLNE
tara:strand:+ start:41343 stop:42506 length:1164 start_codon:yes stop_codon:yes gene_type:complete